MNGDRENRGNQGKRGWMIIAGICVVCFAGCLVWLVSYMLGNRGAQEDMEELRQDYVVEVTGVPVEPEPTAAPEATPAPTAEPSPLAAYDIPNKLVDIKALQENENEDIYAWIIVPGTVIDYPVLQDAERLDYYLDHNVDRSSGYPGCIYSQYLNSKEWDDPNTVLYGHNMKNGSMFAGLHQYEDPQFLEENQYIYIFTEGYVRVYHIFGAYEFDNRHLLLTADMEDPIDFARYLVEIEGLKGMKDHFLEEVPVSIEDKLLTLETCIANKPEKRYIVQAILEEEGEWPIEGAVVAQE
ncbi:MAG: sortase [Lachnospiraceae bacterium]|nr:sortase [Lachnospiraceae bacterium]